MKQHLATRLRAWADRLDPPPDWTPLETAALGLMAHQDSIDGRSGESKRHHVLASLMKAFPDARERDLAWLIERLVRERAHVAE